MVKPDEKALSGIVCIRMCMCVHQWIAQLVKVLAGVAAVFVETSPDHKVGYIIAVLNLQILSCIQLQSYDVH